MAVNFLTKPVLQMNSSDYAKYLQEAAIRSRVVCKDLLDEGLIREGREITPKRIRRALGKREFAQRFDNDGKFSSEGLRTIVDNLEDYGYDCESMMNVTIEEYLERAIREFDPSYVPKLDIMG